MEMSVTDGVVVKDAVVENKVCCDGCCTCCETCCSCCASCAPCCKKFGRVCLRILQLTAFYVIFYCCLAGFFWVTMEFFFLTLDNYKPKWQDRISVPGLTYLPRDNWDYGNEIVFNKNKRESYDRYRRQMERFLRSYDDEEQTNGHHYEDCGDEPGDIRYRGNTDNDTSVRKACRFRREWLGPCSGSDDTWDFGYSQGSPCIIAKLNRIIMFQPRPQHSCWGPDCRDITGSPNMIPIHCTGKKEEDNYKLGEVLYHGLGSGNGRSGGFPLQYYPYYGRLLHDHYLQPLVAIQFPNITLNEQVHIECRVYGDNIWHSQYDRWLGRFELKITVKDEESTNDYW